MQACHALLQGIFPPQVSCIARNPLPSGPAGKPKNTGVDSLSLLQGIFLTQESNHGLLHCRQILYQLSYQEKARYPLANYLSCVKITTLSSFCLGRKNPSP